VIDFKIDNLYYQLGSLKLSYNSIDKKFPSWNIKKVQKKTGIKFIYQSSQDEDVLTLALKSAKKTLKNFNKNNIDCIVVVTQTAKNKLPSTSCLMQDKLGLNKNILSFDINLGCSGFIHALGIINSLLKNNVCKNALLVCADTYTKFIHETNRACKSIFSDGAASCIVSKKCKSRFKPSFNFYSDGSGGDDLIEKNGFITMNGAKVFFFTTNTIPNLINNILKKNKLKISQVDYFIFHQASKLVLDKLENILGIPKHKTFTNYHRIGNTTSSSIPILLYELKKKKKIKKNQIIILSGFGVGLSAATCLIKWN
jgi:3-oxoacyl-[acyl-carrier-protein] synthase-3